MEKEIIYFKRRGLKTVIAANPETGSAIIFNQGEQKWVVAPQNYHQIIYDDYFEEIPAEQAQAVYGNILPDDLMDEIDGVNVDARTLDNGRK